MKETNNLRKTTVNTTGLFQNTFSTISFLSSGNRALYLQDSYVRNYESLFQMQESLQTWLLYAKPHRQDSERRHKQARRSHTFHSRRDPFRDTL
jgi:hypothetical protein